MAAPKKTTTKSDPAANGLEVVEALTPIRHNGADFAPGALFTAGGATAAALIVAGAARIVTPQA